MYLDHVALLFSIIIITCDYFASLHKIFPEIFGIYIMDIK